MPRSNWRSLALLVVTFLLTNGCNSVLGNELNEKFCRAHPDNAACQQAYPDAAVDAPQLPDAPDAPTLCAVNLECMAPTPVCDVSGSRMCVQCTPADNACASATPVCNVNQCEKCTEHTQCSASKVCLPDGSCAAPADVAYVAAGGSGDTCALEAPCATLDEGLKRNRAIVKITGRVKDTKTTTISGKVVALVAEKGGALDRDGDGAILQVQGSGTDVKISDLEISGATGLVGGNGIELSAIGGAPALSLTHVTISSNQGIGISAVGGTLSLSGCTVSANTGGGIAVSGGTLSVSRSSLSGNPGGGIAMTGLGVLFDITNNFILRNGDSSNATVGGASLLPSNTGVSKFEFNTVVDNQVQGGGTRAGGIVCDKQGFAAANNLIARNYIANDATRTNSNVNGICTYPSTAVTTDVGLLKFVSPDSSPYDYHITAGSAAIDQALTPSTVQIDFDGDPRSAAMSDQGADELRP